MISWMRQNGRLGELEVVIAIARERIIREYEDLLDKLEIQAGVIVSSTLATLPLLDDSGTTLLIRMSGKTLTTSVVQGPNLCVYRSSEMAADASNLMPQAMLEEIFPAVAYFQDTFEGTIDRVRLAGFGSRPEVFCNALSAELKVDAAALGESGEGQQLESSAKHLIRQNMDSLVGWMMNGVG